MGQELILALVGGAVGLFTAVVTSWMNRRLLRIIEKAQALRKNYALLPVPVISALKRFENVIWQTFRNPTIEDLNNVSRILDASDALLNAIRTTTADVMKRDEKLSELIGEIPESGYAPPYIRNAVRQTGQRGEGRT